MAKDATDKVTQDLLPTPAKLGRPATGKALSPAERQRASRKARKFADKFDGFSAKSVTVLLSAHAYAALRLLVVDGAAGHSMKEVLETLITRASDLPT